MTDEMKQSKYDRIFMRIAKEWSRLSHCGRNKVGAILVKDGNIISCGLNGAPKGFDNCCEGQDGKTMWHILHAEQNALLKVARSTQSCEGSTLYTTVSPCRDCSKLILQAGVVRVCYTEEYRDPTGIDFLRNSGVVVERVTLSDEVCSEYFDVSHVDTLYELEGSLFILCCFEDDMKLTAIRECGIRYRGECYKVKDILFYGVENGDLTVLPRYDKIMLEIERSL